MNCILSWNINISKHISLEMRYCSGRIWVVPWAVTASTSFWFVQTCAWRGPGMISMLLQLRWLERLSGLNAMIGSSPANIFPTKQSTTMLMQGNQSRSYGETMWNWVKLSETEWNCFISPADYSETAEETTLVAWWPPSCRTKRDCSMFAACQDYVASSASCFEYDIWQIIPHHRIIGYHWDVKHLWMHHQGSYQQHRSVGTKSGPKRRRPPLTVSIPNMMIFPPIEVSQLISLSEWQVRSHVGKFRQHFPEGFHQITSVRELDAPWHYYANGWQPFLEWVDPNRWNESELAEALDRITAFTNGAFHVVNTSQNIARMNPQCDCDGVFPCITFSAQSWMEEMQCKPSMTNKQRITNNGKLNELDWGLADPILSPAGNGFLLASQLQSPLTHSLPTRPCEVLLAQAVKVYWWWDSISILCDWRIWVTEKLDRKSHHTG